MLCSGQSVGPPGPQGDPGSQGPPGQNGMDGSPDSPGVNGSQGEQGLPGSQVCTTHNTTCLFNLHVQQRPSSVKEAFAAKTSS